jgi:hypothetical protein
VKSITPVVGSIVAVPVAGAAPIDHVKGPVPEGAAGVRLTAVFSGVVPLTPATVGAPGLTTVIVIVAGWLVTPLAPVTV